MARVREGDRAPNRAAAAEKARARRGGGGRRGCGLGFWPVGGGQSGGTEGAAVVGAEKVESKNGIARVVVVATPDLLQILDAAVSIPLWRRHWRGLGAAAWCSSREYLEGPKTTSVAIAQAPVRCGRAAHEAEIAHEAEAEKMPLLPTPLRALFSSTTAASTSSAVPPPRLVHRLRPPLAGAFLFLSLGAVAGCALSARRVPFLR
jgi:hypothetical protein